jgi:hypothetical protein
MRKAGMVLVIVALFCALAFAQNGGYVALNNELYVNSASIFKISSSGEIAFVKQLQTGGGGGGAISFGQPQVAFENQGPCLFVADTQGSDIASFKAPGLEQVHPNFSDPSLQGRDGIALAVDPAGKFLYTAWDQSENLAVLGIAPDCSLSLLSTTAGRSDVIDGLTVTHNGKVVVASYPNSGVVQAYKASSIGRLTPLGPALTFANVIPGCASAGSCEPTAGDVTDDGVYWVWGNFAIEPSTLTATLTPNGFTNPAMQTYPDSVLYFATSPRFSPAAAQTDRGNLYVGANADYGPFLPGGIIVTSFDQGSITYESEAVNTVDLFAGGVQTVGIKGTGSPIVTTGYDISGANTLYSYTVDRTALRQAAALPNPGWGGDAFSLAAAPGRP